MKDRYKHMVHFLLENAGPSIRYRVKKEILGEIGADEEQALQDAIMAEPISRLVAGCQKENGWLGNGFHGPNKNAGPYENQEVGVKYLAEKGVRKDNPVLCRAMDAFVTTELTDLCYRTKGKHFDEFRYAANGQNLIRCACIARAGYDDIIDIKPQIQLALDSFQRVLEVDSALDITRVKKVGGKEKRVFNDYERWPCYYHLDILAHTESWKNDDNIKMLAESVKKLMRTDRPECQVGGDSWVGYVLGTVGCIKEGYTLGCEKDGVYYTNLERVEWLCRCGLAPYLPQLQAEVDLLKAGIDTQGICRASVDENLLHGISTYSGQQLEVDWKSETRRLCDITFRALLIFYYADKR
ncbi:MAG: hypothetical protein IJW40_09430 [Clostridia bacterium]|nr:hypothetical protein [Clostridia bacterium]